MAVAPALLPWRSYFSDRLANGHTDACGELSALISRKMRLRFRLARAVSSTRYVIFGADLVEDLTRRPGAAIGHVVKALPDPLGGTGLGREIEQALVGFRVLQHGGGLAVHGQHQWPLGFL